MLPPGQASAWKRGVRPSPVPGLESAETLSSLLHLHTCASLSVGLESLFFFLFLFFSLFFLQKKKKWSPLAMRFLFPVGLTVNRRGSGFMISQTIRGENTPPPAPPHTHTQTLTHVWTPGVHKHTSYTHDDTRCRLTTEEGREDERETEEREEKQEKRFAVSPHKHPDSDVTHRSTDI